MAEIPPKPASPSRKRPAPDDVEMDDVHTTPVKEQPSSPHSSDLSTPKSIASPDESPLPQSSAPALLSSPVPSNSGSTVGVPPPAANAVTSAAGATPAKRRKLTAQEKEKQRLDKETKTKAREEKRLQEARQKEEAKKAREDAKKVKEEETRKKTEEKEAKKREKEAEKQKKVEEEEKKKKAQPKLNKWFTMNAGSGVTVELAHRRRSISAEQGERTASPSNPPSPQKKPQVSDYDQTFLPYERKTHEVLATETMFWADRSDADKDAAIAKLNEMAASGSEHTKQEVLALLEKRDMATLLGVPAAEQGKRGLQYPRVRDIISRLSGSSDRPVDLTQESSEQNMRELLETLKAVPMKFIHFTEDVRPPYCGTFTKIQSERESRKMAINPFSKSLPDANYDYDSEYEWDDPEEGEDLDADDGDDLDSEGAEDLDDFLEDDDDVAHSKRRLITGDLEPVCSGLCWEDSNGMLRKADGSVDARMTFSEYKMGVLLEPRPASIDPFSTVYWQPEPQSSLTAVPGKDTLGMMNPPRLPLHARPENGASVGAKLPASKGVLGTAAAPKPPKRTIPEDLMSEFKDEVKGSDLTKLALIEALKKKFPKIPKDAIANTLSIVAKRVGPNAAEKQWVLLDT